MVVIDASLAVQLLVIEQFSAQAVRLANNWAAMGVRLAAPDFIYAEVTSALYKKISAGMLSDSLAVELMTEFCKMDIKIYSASLLYQRAIALALELRQRTPYDSHYLALAEALGCDFWTADRPFYRAERQGYLRVRWVGNL